MITTATVKIWSHQVGVVQWDPTTGVASFEYFPKFTKSNLQLSPFKMPTSSIGNVFYFPALRDTSFHGLPGLLADSLPDRFGNELINSWLLSQNRPQNSMNPVEKLCFIGSRSMGAMEFIPATPRQSDKSTKLEIDSLISLASDILMQKKTLKENLKTNKDALRQILRVGTSAGGQRPKAIIAYNIETAEVRSGQGETPEGFEHYILKFDGVKDKVLGAAKGWGKIEMAYHKMAVCAGIEMMPCFLIYENKRAHFVTKRFDRKGAKTKIHTQTFGALQHFDYNNPTSYSYEELFTTAINLGCRIQLSELYRRMVFNVFGRNCDDHVKNFSFIMDKTGKWSLSPAYDICHSFNPESTWTKHHNLGVLGKRVDIQENDLLKFADNFKIDHPRRIITEVKESIKKWETFAKIVGVSPVLTKEIKRTLLV